MFQELLSSLLQPGITFKFMLILNIILISLIILLSYVIYTEIDTSIHMYIMIALAFGLCTSVNYVVAVANGLKKTTRQNKKRTKTN